MKKLVLLSLFCFFVIYTEAQTTASQNISESINEKIEEALSKMISEEKDAIEIISIDPKQNLVHGDVYTFSIVVAYNLVSKEHGILNIGFNNGLSEKSHRLISEASKIIGKGSGYHIFKVNTNVINWSEIGGAFYASTNMSEHPHENKWQPLAFDKFFLAVR